MVPGMGDDGKLSEKGIPAAIVTAFLGQRGIVPSRTTDFMVLCLFSVGVTKGKWGTLINVLLEFKQHYDSNTPISVCLPDLAKNYPHQYAHKGLKVLCDEMFAYMKISEMDKLQAEAFSHLPTPVVLPRQAFQIIWLGGVSYYLSISLLGVFPLSGLFHIRRASQLSCRGRVLVAMKNHGYVIS